MKAKNKLNKKCSWMATGGLFGGGGGHRAGCLRTVFCTAGTPDRPDTGEGRRRRNGRSGKGTIQRRVGCVAGRRASKGAERLPGGPGSVRTAMPASTKASRMLVAEMACGCSACGSGLWWAGDRLPSIHWINWADGSGCTGAEGSQDGTDQADH